MDSDEAGAPEEPTMRPDKQAETHEGDSDGKTEGRLLLYGPMCLGVCSSVGLS